MARGRLSGSDFLDVASNLAFTLAGLAGLILVLRPRTCFEKPGERWPYLVFAIGVLSGAFLQRRGRGSALWLSGGIALMALDAVDLLRRKGFRAHRMEHGVPEWRAQGWRVETGAARPAAGRP